MSTEISRIYHPYWLWEEYKLGFYNNFSNNDFKRLRPKVIELFSSYEDTSLYMDRVVNEFLYSCEHNLSNTSMNRVAFLGQCASLLHNGSPSELTMKSWKYVPEEYQKQANIIAESIINKYVENLFRGQCLTGVNQ